MKTQNNILLATLLLLVMALALPSQAIRLKDVASIEGIRDNQLGGLGIVIGLDGTGDSSSNEFTNRSVMALLRRNGINVTPDDIKAENVAMVWVTATLPPFAKPGSKIDILVNSLGDAINLQGGTLVMSPLKAPDGKVYAVAQGPLSLGGFGVASGGNSVQKNHPTVARIPNGAIIERGANITIDQKDEIHVLLSNPDFTTAARVAKAINVELGDDPTTGIAHSVDSGTIAITIPEKYKGRVVDFISKVENVPVFPDQKAMIIMEERTGTLIMGEDVRISTVAIAHGDLTFQISQYNRVVQPNPFSETGETTLETNSSVSVQEDNVKITVLPGSVSLSEVVSGLNALGVTSRDLISILQAVKAAGALQAEIEIR